MAAPAQTCSRCHERVGEIEIPPQAIVDDTQKRTYWFCAACADALGRSKPSSS